MTNKNIEQITRGLGGLLKQAASATKKAAQTAVAAVEQHANREGLKKIVDGVQIKVEEAKTYVRQHGGVANVIETAVGRATEAMEPFFKQINDRYDAFESEYFPGGKLDKEKAAAALRDRAQVIKRFGVRAADSLAELARQNMVDFKDQYPLAEERARLYPGVGTAYLGVLSKKDYEACIGFDSLMKERAAGKGEYSEILADIKPNAITTKQELLEFYRSKDDMARLAVARRLVRISGE